MSFLQKISVMKLCGTFTIHVSGVFPFKPNCEDEDFFHTSNIKTLFIDFLTSVKIEISRLNKGYVVDTSLCQIVPKMSVMSVYNTCECF